MSPKQGRWLVFVYSLCVLACLVALASLFGHGQLNGVLPSNRSADVAVFSAWSGALGAVAISLKGVYDHRPPTAPVTKPPDPAPVAIGVVPPPNASSTEHSQAMQAGTTATGSELTADGYADTTSPWDNDWLPWYLGRPFTGIIVGIAVFILLKAVYPSGTPNAATIAAASFVLGTQESRFFDWVKQIGAVVVSIPQQSNKSAPPKQPPPPHS
jgi:hypothetical protein